jgi:hypothetical protein
VVVSFIDGGNRWTRRKPLTCRKSLVQICRYPQDTHIQMANRQIFWVSVQQNNVFECSNENLFLLNLIFFPISFEFGFLWCDRKFRSRTILLKYFFLNSFLLVETFFFFQNRHESVLTLTFNFCTICDYFYLKTETKLYTTQPEYRSHLFLTLITEQ